MSSFELFVPEKSKKLLRCWINELNIEVKISKPRKNKLGDFKVRNNHWAISINNNLNKYSFLITLTHELAHAFVFKKYAHTVSPHGKSWQLTFRSLMLNFLSPDYFPKDILQVLSHHMIKPKASTFTDLKLVEVLNKYNKDKVLTLMDLAVGDLFTISSGRSFIKGKKIRKRYRCIDPNTNKVYLFHPFTEVIVSQ